MRFPQVLKYSTSILFLCLCAQAQTPPAKDTPSTEAKGLPLRANPTDYQAQAKAGTVTLGAEFMRHAVNTPQGEFSAEEYVVVEVGLFGAAGERLKVSTADFSLRINGKKAALPGQPFGVIFATLKDPNWEPPEPVGGAKPKGGAIKTGGDEKGEGGAPPAPVHMPVPLRHAMEQKVQKAALPEGDRALPLAGLLFFYYRNKSTSIQSVELLYSGPAGKATLDLQP